MHDNELQQWAHQDHRIEDIHRNTKHASLEGAIGSSPFSINLYGIVQPYGTVLPLRHEARYKALYFGSPPWTLSSSICER